MSDERRVVSHEVRSDRIIYHYDDGTQEEQFEGANVDELRRAVAAYPDHAPSTALANYRAGREVWDTNGDLW